ncbi:acyl-CoA dehydrogenase family protein [Metapseudomonas resinovorans]|uniref:Putative acyl-CoA dehydrogenase n=1 Tax=Metapseudomonas resinovorans NBRC 106553 TaxID=1245471 RepID=S6BMI3_METRE|nr:acyl-CoA dehydrogenase family protein [Pseudomonas resinovorans]BAN50454.1 putative acyl-CoA dehydrogenase [Pseudomonas resinovorans NBRC 106553]
MTYALSPETLEWQRKARDFAEQLIPHEEAAEFNEGLLPKEITAGHRATGIELGFSRMDVPREHGGLQLPMLDQVVVWEQLGRVTNALSWCISEAHSWMYEACDAAQIEAYIKPIWTGEKTECYAITEREAGSDTHIETSAVRQGEHYLISGEKWFVTSANKAQFMFVQARVPDGQGGGEDALFFVDVDSPGIEIIDNPLFGHNFASHHPTYRFDRVRVPVANRIGAEGDGMAYTKSWFRRERLMIAARSLGAAQRMLEMATDWSKERVVGGQPICEHQMIQTMLADSLTDLWGARLMTYEAAKMQDRGEDLSVIHAHCSMAKLVASEMVNRVADRVVQIFGGRGYMRSNAAQRFYREVRVDRIWEGTSEIQRLIIARSLLKRGAERLIG